MLALFMLIAQAFAADPAKDVIIKSSQPITVYAYQIPFDRPTTVLADCSEQWADAGLVVIAPDHRQLAAVTTGRAGTSAPWSVTVTNGFFVNFLYVSRPYGDETLIFASAKELDDMPKFLAWVKSGKVPEEFVWTDAGSTRSPSTELKYQTVPPRTGLTKMGNPVDFYIFTFTSTEFNIRLCPSSGK